MKSALCLLILSLCIYLGGCKKDSFILTPGAQVFVTADTLKYDTVFSTAGSITQSFKIINENSQKLRLSSVKLSGGSTSFFKINVDGNIGPEINDIEIAPNDSVYVFASVNINPNVANLPFVVRDSIEIDYNGASKWVQLEAWGQNAHFLRDREISNNQSWTNDLPYVILGSLVVDSNATLSITKGCRVYVHGDAPVLINGSLNVSGEKDSVDRVYFRGDRLDDPYKDFPASWPGIFFNTKSNGNVLTYAVIKNAYQAIAAQDPSPDSNPKITLNECIIDNAYDAGIITINSSVSATNCLVSNCGKNLYLLMGGNYNFTHCTVVSYSNDFLIHKDPALLLSNYVSVDNVPQIMPLTAVFRNCIFWGDNGTVADEVVVAKSGNATFAVNFDFDLWKIQQTDPGSTPGVTVAGIVNNEDPMFNDVNTSKNSYDFRLQTGSPAIDKGVNTRITRDLDGNLRPVGAPDLGCYEKQ